MTAFNKKTLELKATVGAWRLYSARKSDPKFEKYQLKVWQRDDNTCQFCGFKAQSYQEIINLDNNYRNNKQDNMVTSCCFCAQCCFLESVGVGGYGGGNLIYLPEFSQSELNSLCHVLFCAITNDTGYKNSAQTIYRDFRFRSQIVEDKFGEGTSDPAIFGQLIIDSNVANDEQTTQKLFQGVRLLPSRAKFRKQIEHWATRALEEITE